MKRWIVALVFAPTLAACEDAVSPKPWERAPWEEVSSPPEWVHRHEHGTEFISFVDGGTSQVATLAYSFDEARVRYLVETQVCRRLKGVLGTDAAQLAFSKLPAPRFVARAMYADASHTSGELLVGPVYYSAWVRWDLPESDILALIPEEQREKARGALRNVEPLGAPTWREVPSQPQWARSGSASDSDLAIVATRVSDMQSVAQASADAQALSALLEGLTSRLKDVVAPGDMPAIARRAAMLATVSERVLTRKTGSTSAWILWKVPIEASVEGLCEKLKTSVRSAFAK